MKVSKFIIIGIMLAGLSVINVKADERSYVWTYEYMTMERGAAELEQYTTFKTVDTDDFPGTSTADLDLELEFGMTDNFDFAVYQSFSTDVDGNLSYKGFKLRGRYKIGKKGDFFVDPLIYLEYKSNPGFSKHVIEPKLILAKDFGKFNIALNPYCEYEIVDEEKEFKLKFAGGISYAFGKLFKAGVEMKADANGKYFGPTISHGNGDMFVALGSLWGTGVKEGKPKQQIRMIIGIHL